MRKMYILIFSILLFTGNLLAQCGDDGGGRRGLVYIGFGTGISTFAGGDFGSRFAMRVTSPYFNDYRDNYNSHFYYNRYVYNDNYYDDRTSFNPLEGSITIGVQPTKSLAFEITTTLRWHTYGNPDPQYETGTFNGNSYIDRFDNSDLFTVPVIASVKYYPFADTHNNMYLTAGFGYQYTSESIDRVREFYDYNSYYGDYNPGYQYTLATYSDTKWYPVFKAGIGYLYRMPEHLAGSFELAYTNFISEVWNNNPPLAMHRTKYVGNISLGMNLYFGL